MIIVCWLVCFLASVIGAICGIGGGVIIKPFLDALGIMDVATISFLSGITVLSMTSYSLAKSVFFDKSKFQKKIVLMLSFGGVVGGILGKWLFSFLRNLSTKPDRIGAIQASCLLVVTIATLFYTVKKDKIKSKSIQNIGVCLSIGLVLGVLSSFLGIGGGPINLVVLFYFFSMPTKTAVECSLCIIFFSQIAALATTIIGQNLPDFSWKTLLVMVAGGIMGAVVGRKINKKIDSKMVEYLFIGLMVIIVFINIYNIYKFF